MVAGFNTFKDEMSSALADKHQARLSAQKQEFLDDPATKKILSDYAEKKRQLDNLNSNDENSSSDDDVIKRQ